MHLNVYYIDKLATELDALLSNKRLTDCFTTSINEVFFCFDEVILRCQFYHGELFYQIVSEDKLQKKNRLNAFPNLIGKSVEKVAAVYLDRAFVVHLNNDCQLVFYNYGRFGSIVYYEQDNWDFQFPIKSRRVEELVISDNSFVASQSAEEAKKTFGFISVDDLNSFEYPLTEEQWTSYLNRKRTETSYCIVKQNNNYSLRTDAKECVAQYESILDALSDYTPLYIGSTSYFETKRKLLSESNSEIKKLNKRIAKIEGVLMQESSGVYKEYADLLMANLYAIEAGVSKVELLSFDGQKSYNIKINKDLSPQANAEKYYKKSKNEYKNKEIQARSLKEAKNKLAEKLALQEAIDKCENYRELKKFVKHNKTDDVQVRLPYRRMEIDGFEIRIGKGAKDNDELLRAHSTKNDLWLHAKDVAGSHVIVRTNGVQLPNRTLEKIASIAAYYSKAKSESLVPVIYTERKFVRKPKGAHPGLVKLDREDVVLVEPSLPNQ